METVAILIADDEALLLLDFECALTEAGFGVVAVTSGSKAIEHLTAADSSIQGIVTDIRFGESPDGWEVARVAREIDPGMPVVYVSGHGAVDFPSRGVPKSVMLEKPFDMAQLVTAISQLLDERSSETLPPPPPVTRRDFAAYLALIPALRGWRRFGPVPEFQG